MKLLSLNGALQRLHMFLYGVSFTLVTDHRPFKSCNKTNPEMLPWAPKFSTYNDSIEHKPWRHKQTCSCIAAVQQTRQAFASSTRCQFLTISLHNKPDLSRDLSTMDGLIMQMVSLKQHSLRNDESFKKSTYSHSTLHWKNCQWTKSSEGTTAVSPAAFQKLDINDWRVLLQHRNSTHATMENLHFSSKEGNFAAPTVRILQTFGSTAKPIKCLRRIGLRSNRELIDKDIQSNSPLVPNQTYTKLTPNNPR